jgi:hypothetical protein
VTARDLVENQRAGPAKKPFDFKEAFATPITKAVSICFGYDPHSNQVFQKQRQVGA